MHLKCLLFACDDYYNSSKVLLKTLILFFARTSLEITHCGFEAPKGVFLKGVQVNFWRLEVLFWKLLNKGVKLKGDLYLEELINNI